jgi:hypothetical protein
MSVGCAPSMLWTVRYCFDMLGGLARGGMCVGGGDARWWIYSQGEVASAEMCRS